MKKYFLEMCSGIRLLGTGVLLAGSLYGAPALAADDVFVCMEESQEICDQKNKNLELYIKGTDAFDRGRAIGDLTEAHEYAAALIARNDLQHGKALMKHIYLQLGQGVHKDLVQAYRWVAADVEAGTQYKRLDPKRILDQLAARMTPEQLAEAKR